MTNEQEQLLIQLAEECGEAVQACTKLLRHGPESYHPDHPERGTNTEQLQKECGDIMALIDLLCAASITDGIQIHRERLNKLATIRNHNKHIASCTQSDAVWRVRRFIKTTAEAEKGM